MQLNPVDVSGQHSDSDAGTIATLSNLLYTEYALSGYSTQADEIETALAMDYAYYVGWATSSSQEKGQSKDIDRDKVITINEWAVIEPLIRAHCDLLQANRMEANASLGTERFGLSVSEASMNYNNAKEKMQKEAFVEPPFTLDF